MENLSTTSKSVTIILRSKQVISNKKTPKEKRENLTQNKNKKRENLSGKTEKVLGKPGNN